MRILKLQKIPIVSKISERKLTAIIEPSGEGFVISCPVSFL